MIIESENQYQDALNQIELLIKQNNGVPPAPDTVAGRRLQDYVAEIKIYENRYSDENGEDVPTFEFWSPKEGVVQGESQDPNDYEIIKLRENELQEKHILILANEFMTQFDKLPAAARRIVRKKLQY